MGRFWSVLDGLEGAKIGLFEALEGLEIDFLGMSKIPPFFTGGQKKGRQLCQSYLLQQKKCTKLVGRRQNAVF